MELKDYQLEVINDLQNYLQTLIEQKGLLSKAFSEYWIKYGIREQKYKNNIKDTPHVCVKVPTAGGKTYIAVNAIDKIFSAFAEYNPTRPKVVVWLVPSLTILEQTVKNLTDSDHPYRRRLNVLFKGRVEVFEKTDVLMGNGFNVNTVQDQLSIIVMSFDSLKTKLAENRKTYQENGYLASFLNADYESVPPLDGVDPTALINVLRSLNPVVIVDESHNAESDLSVEMLNNLNPGFVFDLTATPRNNSNIISYVDALRLKKQNMVKLPVIVANQRTQEEVITAALSLRRQLEEFAKKSEETGGGYIRPIALFQAEPKNKADTTTFAKVKSVLIDLGIPENQIAIKTATINELKGVDLMSRDCQIRYIITVNALKEGWDCPFAYVLASLANKSSTIDVTQILGRILRMPYTQKPGMELLGLSYVFTCSSQFQESLGQVVEGLNKAGFSKKDYREVDGTLLEGLLPSATPQPLFPPVAQAPVLEPESDATDEGEEPESNVEIDTFMLDSNWESNAVSSAASFITQPSETSDRKTNALDHLKTVALQQAKDFEVQAQQATESSVPHELRSNMAEHKMRSGFEESAMAIKLPQFFLKLPADGGFFETTDEWHLLSKENLLSDFMLANLDATFNFASIDAEVYSVDAEEVGQGDSSPAFKPVRKAEKDKLNSIIKGYSNASQEEAIVSRLFSLIGKNTFYPIEDTDVKRYLRRIVQSMDTEQRSDCLERDYAYVKAIKEKIQGLASEFAAKEFTRYLTTGKVRLQPHFVLPKVFTSSETAPAISKSLYDIESKVNGLESKVITSVASMDNIVWWHRNMERGKGFVVNGYINHYPDFIVLTASRNILLIETKGDDRDNSDSKEKLKLGQLWAAQANQLSHLTGYRYHYMMVFESNPIDDAYVIADALKIIRDL